LLNQTSEKTPENPIDPQLPATGKRGLRFRVKTANGGLVIGRRTGRRKQGRKKTASGHPDAAFREEAV